MSDKAVKDMQQEAYLKAMGIDIWLPRGAAESTTDTVSVDRTITEVAAANPAAPMADEAISRLDWSALQARVSTCTQCELHRGRTHTVFGVGNPQADLLIIGEAPGADEDRQGEPFVGRAGQLLTAMLKAIRFDRQDVYIANILKCRPPNNRDPKAEEVSLCSHYLERQIELIQPKLILAVGRIAAQRLLQTDSSLAKMRGRVFQYAAGNIPLIVTYHPAYLLRTPSDKGKAWQDLLFVQRTLGGLANSD